MAGPYAEGREAIQRRLFAAQEQPHRMQEYLQMQQQRQQQMQDQAQQRQMQAQETLRQRALEDTTRRQAGEGAAAFAGYMKNPEMTQPGIPGATPGVQSATEALRSAGAPNVGLVPQLPKPEMAPLKLQNVVTSIQKQNPKISPEGLLSALEKFQPYFDAQDRRDLVTMKASAGGGGGSDFARTLNHFLAQGMPYDEAEARALAVKRTTASEVGEKARQQEIGKTSIARETSQKTLGGMFDIMDTSLESLRKNNAIIDDEKTAGENLLIAAKTSGVGRAVSSRAGDPNETLRRTIDSLKPRALLAIMQAGGASARALDSNVELKTWLETMGDTGKYSYQTNKAMLESLKAHVKSFNVDLDGGGENKTPAAQAPAPAALPAGWSVQIGQ